MNKDRETLVSEGLEYIAEREFCSRFELAKIIL
jgi:hypothetical protein